MTAGPDDVTVAGGDVSSPGTRERPGGGPRPAAEYRTAGGRFRQAALQDRNSARAAGAAVDTGWLPRRPSAGTMIRALADTAAGLLSRRHRVPTRIQSQTTDCGPACLAMVLAYHGVHVSIEELRRDTNTGRDGVSARVLLETARRHGVPGRGVRAGIGELRLLPAATILFWSFRHFVVLERATTRYVDVVDPAFGRRRIPLDAASSAFTGVALEFHRPLRPAAGKRRVSARQRLAASPWRYLAYFAPRNRAWIPLVAASLPLLLFNFITPVALDYIVGQSRSGHLSHGTQPLVAAFLGLVLLFFVLQASRGLAITALQAAADKQVTLGVLDHLLSLPYAFFARRNAGDLAMRVRTSLAVRRVLTSSALSTIFDGLLILLYAALLLLADTRLGLLVVALAILQVTVLVVSWKSQHHLTANTLDLQSNSEGELIELLDGIATLKAAGLDGAAGERWSHSFTDEVNARTRGGRYYAVSAGLSACLQFAAPLAVLVIGVMQVSQHQAPLGEVIGFSSLAMGLFVPLNSLVLTGMQVAGLGRTLARFSDILEAEPENRGSALPVHEVRGAVEMRDVHFSYPGNRDEVIKGISMIAAPGEFVAILGKSGCGKSTLASVLGGLYVATRGDVIIDGMATDKIDRTALRRSISFVNQDTKLFAGTVRDNIAVSRQDAADTDIVAAAETAGIHADIRGLPMGYDTLLGPGGVGLSGGQKQRIALARALVRQPRLLILDEATSALDRATESQILGRLLAVDCTLIVIAHRLAAAELADQILVLRDGELVQHGTHHRLLAVAGPYQALAFGQSGVAAGAGAARFPAAQDGLRADPAGSSG
jgi:ABC-type bacteriocin/lantibiotic exporter with double-glycine peptidase domain